KHFFCVLEAFPWKRRALFLSAISLLMYLKAYIPLTGAAPPRTSWSYLSSFLNKHYMDFFTLLVEVVKNNG
ncbi:hypothetical protein, partial [Pseudogracilibacillus sp. SO30301A]|uniref:hypothetical protein n=1 Tax=Pseudogracilibacillus sp. SO30301A TaxID=3098291 RepID=UPI00300E0061